MVSPADDSGESEEAWRARAFRSKKAVPRPHKPAAKRVLAPRPQLQSTPTKELRPIPTRDESETTNFSVDPSSPSTPLPQSTPVTYRSLLEPSGYRKLADTQARNERSREKRVKLSDEIYIGSRKRVGMNEKEQSHSKSPLVGSDDSKDVLTPSSASDACSGYFTTVDSRSVKEEVLSPQLKPMSTPLSRTTSPPFESGTGEANDRTSAALVLPNPQCFFGAGRSDPFNSHPVKPTPQLELLIDCFCFHCHRSETSQPFAVFSSLLIPDRELFHARSLLGVKQPGSQPAVFPILFRLALNDPPLFNALLFIAEFAAHGKLTEDSLRYQGNAIRTLNEKLRDPNKAGDNATICTILLLSGFEYIKGNNRPAHEAHMKGLSHLLKLREELGGTTESTDEQEVIERGMFWADVLGAVLLGSRRFFSLEAFPSMRLLEAVPRPTNPLPPGFACCLHLLNDDLIEIIRDIVDFQEVVESQSKSNVILNRLKVFNDRKASIECRLASISLKGLAGGKYECCRLAAYLFSSAMFPPMFGPPTLANVLSTQLATALAQTDLTGCWDADMKLLVWICFMGASHTDLQSRSSVFMNVLSIALRRFDKTCRTWDRTIKESLGIPGHSSMRNSRTTCRKIYISNLQKTKVS